MSLLLLLTHLVTNYTRGTSSTLPTTNDDLSVKYTTSDYAGVATDDGTYVGESGQFYLMHQFKYYGTDNTQGITLTWNGNSTTAPVSRTVYLQIWNYSTSLWETVASNNTATASTDFTLTGSKTTSLGNYYDSNLMVTARVYQ